MQSEDMNERRLKELRVAYQDMPGFGTTEWMDSAVISGFGKLPKGTKIHCKLRYDERLGVNCYLIKHKSFDHVAQNRLPEVLFVVRSLPLQLGEENDAK